MEPVKRESEKARKLLVLEACVDDLDSAHAAVLGGADRLELCDNLADGGTTPSHGMLGYLLDTLDIPVFPIIRPRGGDFCYSGSERRVMARDVDHALSLGARGIVTGALTAEGEIDIEALRDVVLHRSDVAVTFHRAFDLVRDPIVALETLIEAGVARILTSGQHATAWEGRALLAELVRRAGERIVVMAGGGIHEDHVTALVRETGVSEIHVRAATLRVTAPGWPQPPVGFRKALPETETARWVTDPIRIGIIGAAARQASG